MFSLKEIKNNQEGAMLIVSLVLSSIFLVVLVGTVNLGILQQKLNIRKVAKAQALYVAEAGVNYYRWVLYHDHEEYCNKETCIPGEPYGPYGPYEYTDSSGQGIKGLYELYIEPPAINGSTIVTIKSVGWLEEFPNVKRTIEVKCGIPSWSKYSTLANSFMRFGSGTEVWGPIHSNSGMRFDGIAHNVLSSSVLDYNDPDHAGPNEYGVHTHAHAGGTYDSNELSDGSNPPNPPEYSDVFLAGRSFPSQSISFDLLDNHVSEMLTKAEDKGLVYEHSGSRGYHITLNPDNTFDIKVVTGETSSCWGARTEGVSSETTQSLGVDIPENGIIFIKDKIWIDGQINNSRITILAFETPIAGASSDIILNNDLTYTNYDGTDSIGLIAQNNITVGLYSEDDLRIDAALVAKEGRIGRNYYSFFCGGNRYKDTITVFGSLATKNRYGFAYTDGTGYDTRNLMYDNSLTFIPPPHFPTTGEYTFISWKEE